MVGVGVEAVVVVGDWVGTGIADWHGSEEGDGAGGLMSFEILSVVAGWKSTS